MASIKSLELPCGIESEGGVVRKNIEIRKLKGKVQRDIARLQAAKRPDAGAILDAILMPSVIGVEGEKPAINDIRLMLIADRDWLLFELRKHTWGSIISIKNKCTEPGCGEVTSYPDFDLDDLETVTLDDAPWWDGNDAIPAEVVAKMSESDCKSLRCRVVLLENEELGESRLPYTMLYKVETDLSLTPWAVLDSLGDNSYPSVVVTDDEVLIAYYSQHEDRVDKVFLAAFDKDAFLAGHVPEPSTFVLAATGFAALCLLWRKRRARSAG